MQTRSTGTSTTTVTPTRPARDERNYLVDTKFGLYALPSWTGPAGTQGTHGQAPSRTQASRSRHDGSRTAGHSGHGAPPARRARSPCCHHPLGGGAGTCRAFNNLEVVRLPRDACPGVRRRLGSTSRSLKEKTVDDDGLLTAADRGRMEGRTPDAVRAAQRRGDGPPVIRLGPRVLRWRYADWKEWTRRHQLDAASADQGDQQP